MVFISKPAALALLSCCLVFGVLLGLTGLAKESRPTEASAAKAALRGPSEPALIRRALANDKEFTKQNAREEEEEVLEEESKQQGQEELASVMWPEFKGETGGLWGPDDEERQQLHLDNIGSAADGMEDGSFWDADLDEKEGLADALLNGNWDRLMEVDMDESFSFSYTM